DTSTAPLASAMVDFITRVVGWKVDGRYYILNEDVSNRWEGGIRGIESVTDLRQILALDPELKVLIAHGYNDLVCPYLASDLIVAKIPSRGASSRIEVLLYPGGHLF